MQKIAIKDFLILVDKGCGVIVKVSNYLGLFLIFNLVLTKYHDPKYDNNYNDCFFYYFRVFHILLTDFLLFVGLIEAIYGLIITNFKGFFPLRLSETKLQDLSLVASLIEDIKF